MTFHEGWPDGLKLNFDPGIFHDPKHLKLQASSGWHFFYAKNDNLVEAILYVHIDKSTATSSYRSPFGSFLFSDSIMTYNLHDFIVFCESALKRLEVKTIVFKNQSELYSKNIPTLNNTLIKEGFSTKTEETSAVIPVNSKPFESGLHKSEKKRLRKCREQGLTFERIDLSQLQKIYMFLEACREEKGYSLSMSFDEIKKLVQAFPERIILTAVIDQQKFAAANISIRVFDHVLYNFYHDHSSEYDLLSPVVLLNEGLYNFCQQTKIELLDLGTSNLDGKLNESLLNFKINLGAKPTRKLTFEKKLV